MTSDKGLHRTCLFEEHHRLGAKLVDFAGWELPVQYSSVMTEHHAVRRAAGIFDVSHMGEFRVSGPGAEAFLQSMTPNDVSKLTPGRIHYSGLLTESGTYVDDLLVYRLGETEFLLVVNAANTAEDLAWLEQHRPEDVVLEDVSHAYGLIALQGPRSVEILAALTEVDLETLRYYRFAVSAVVGHEAIVSRTGYTGEDGFELYVSPDGAPEVWQRLLESGTPLGLLPAGLGARDTLRLEAAMALYGHELDTTTTPFEAGLDWVVKMEKGEFVGRKVLSRQLEDGLDRRLVGFEMEGRGIGRQGYEVWIGDEVVGMVTSGTFSPTLERAIGMAYVPTDSSEPGTHVEIQIRQHRVPAKIVSLPFYKRSG